MECHENQPRGIKKKKLQCPFTWSTPILSDEALLHETDTLCLAGDTWSLVLRKLLLAYQSLMREDVKRSQILLVECYMPLLQVKGFYKCDTDLIEDYRIALKHVIDSTWAFVCCKRIPVKELELFLQSITPFSSMTDVQKAAIWGIRGRLSYSEDGLKATDIAISLNPKEGLWYLYKGFILFHCRVNNQIASIREIKALETSYLLRPTPESTVAYAVALTHQHRRFMDTKKGLQILREGISRWPDNPYINLECGIAFSKNHTRPDDLIQAEKFFRNAVKLVGPGNCKAVCQALGSFLIHFRDKAEGKKYIHMASDIDRS